MYGYIVKVIKRESNIQLCWCRCNNNNWNVRHLSTSYQLFLIHCPSAMFPGQLIIRLALCILKHTYNESQQLFMLPFEEVTMFQNGLGTHRHTRTHTHTTQCFFFLLELCTETGGKFRYNCCLAFIIWTMFFLSKKETTYLLLGYI